MAEWSAFNAAVAAEPDDDLPRLLAADWCDDRGDPRGEFIRLQIAAAKGDPAALTPEAKARQEELHQQYSKVWAGDLAKWAYVVGYRRGFVDSIILPAETFYHRAGEIMRQAPVRRVTLIGCRPVLRHLVRLPHLERLTALHLTNSSLGDSDVEKLAECCFLGHLQSLRLGNNGVSSAGLAALATSRFLKELRRLDAPNNEVGDWGARVLSETPTLTKLERLDLSNNALTDTGIEFLRRSPSLTHLRHLDVTNQRASDSSLRLPALSEA